MKNHVSALRKAAAVVGILSVTMLGAATAFAADTIAPTVLGVSSSAANGSYTAGAVIPVQVTFSEPVVVTGVPYIQLATGSTTLYAARYVSGSGTNTLTFNYTVIAGNHTPDLDYMSTNALLVLFASIKDAAGNNAIRTLPAPSAAGSLGANKDIVLY